MTVSNKNIADVIRILRKKVKSLPDPSVTLVGKRWRDPFLVLISCILSLRTKDQTTLPASERLFRLADNPTDMSTLNVKEIEKAIYPVGFYRTKSKNILGICQDLLNKFQGKVPDDLDILLTLKGVGRKTANLVLTEGFGKPGICVDTHVHRISNRLGYVKTKTPYETEMALRAKLPLPYWISYNSLLVLWGQNVCRPLSPLCSSCAIQNFCAKKEVKKSR
ncbi:MAG TPA: endonuclease III [Candidatus Omnitrophota bacterium]|mgnify:CR=1 FL=1|nr:endonuclease III [Candidatus Omnitrophota bacterium]HPN88314.1 endonuclease III [Candidatus Omnitrophota bacterium]